MTTLSNKNIHIKVLDIWLDSVNVWIDNGTKEPAEYFVLKTSSENYNALFAMLMYAVNNSTLINIKYFEPDTKSDLKGEISGISTVFYP